MMNVLFSYAIEKSTLKKFIICYSDVAQFFLDSGKMTNLSIDVFLFALLAPVSHYLHHFALFVFSFTAY
jgi:hypothetical protein